MAMPSGSFSFSSDLEVEKSLIWKTEIPFLNKARQSSCFSLMGLRWCLRFSYKGIPSPLTTTSTGDVYHVVTLHQVINGNVSLASTASKKFLDKGFSIKTFLKHPMSIGSEEIGVNTVNAVYPIVTLWYAGSNKDDISKKIPGLYDHCEVKVVCRFYGQPLSEFQVKIIEDSQSSWKLDKSVQVSAEVLRDLESLSSDFSQLLEKGILPDVTVECGGRTFQAHMSVLAARSEVFQAMFQNELLESETRAVKVSNMDADVLEKLLKFIYSGKLGDLTEKNTADLYEAADKYDIVSLKNACSCWMIRNLTEENCISYLQVAGSHSDPDLKEAVISFIVKNSKVLTSEAWFTFLKEPSDLANEVFKAYIALGQGRMGPLGHRAIARSAGTGTYSGAGARATVCSHMVCYGVAASQMTGSAAACPICPVPRFRFRK